ncbi:MAG: tetratricopeptide repeat protein [Gemmataceae bacterium]
MSVELDRAEALNNRGAARAQAGDRAGAFADYDAALAINPNLAAAYNNRGVTRFQMGDREAALADLEAAIRLDPSYAVAFDNCAVAQASTFDHIRAVASYGRAIELYGDDPKQASRRCTAHVMRALARYHLDHELPLVLADLRAAYQLVPDLCSYIVVVAIEDGARNHAAAALASCDAHLARNPTDYFSLVRRGLTHLLLGNQAAAEADYDAALWAPVLAGDFKMGMAFLKLLETRHAKPE